MRIPARSMIPMPPGYKILAVAARPSGAYDINHRLVSTLLVKLQETAPVGSSQIILRACPEAGYIGEFYG